jgi:phage baseplate assembly protein W
MANSNADYLSQSRKARRAFGCQLHRMVDTARAAEMFSLSVASSKVFISTIATGSHRLRGSSQEMGH